MLLTDLADVLRGAGQRVREHGGWRGHRHGQLDAVRGIVWHHTATPRSSGVDGPVSVVRNGRSDLPGPLAQLALDHGGTWHVLSDGLAWHAGSGSWPGLSGNPDTIGIEALNAGTADEWPWPAAQVTALRAGTAALARHYDVDVARVIGHKEWTTRKIDPYGFDMDDERRRVAALMDDDDGRADPMLPLREGDGDGDGRGQDVRALQRMLQLVGEDDLELDGVYGPATRRAVKRQLVAGDNDGSSVDGWRYARLVWKLAKAADRAQPDK